MTKHSNVIIKKIHSLLAQGLSSRVIANELGISKSSVNNYRDGRGLKQGANILFFDLESAPSIVATFKRWKANIGPESVIEENGHLISACWMFLGDKKVTRCVQTPKEAKARDDSRIVAALYEAFEKADIVVAHNGKSFDVPLFKARLVANNMPPHKSVKIVDTLLIARKFKFNSNRLDSLGNYLKVGRKSDHIGMPMWLHCLEGNQASLKDMVDYNEQDVHLLVDVYMKLRSFDMLPPNLGLYYDDGEVHCPVCGSTHVHSTGNLVYTAVSAFEEMACDDCGNRSRTRKAINSKEHRAKLLASPKQ